MVTDPPTRLVILMLTVAVCVTFAVAIPKLRPSENGSDDAKDQTTVHTDQQSMVLKTETTEGKEPVFIEFSNNHENGNQKEVIIDDPGRYSYSIIGAPKMNTGRLIPVVRGNEDDAKNWMVVKDDEEKQNSAERSREGADSILQWNVRSQTDLSEENVPGSHNWPKHMPEEYRPIPPFPDDERVIAKEPNYTPGKQTKRDEGFVPGERLPPPPRAGPYLYPQSFADREFRVLYN